MERGLNFSFYILTVKLNWICELCGKPFGGPIAISNHVQMKHSTERPFKCETCGVGYELNSLNSTV